MMKRFFKKGEVVTTILIGVIASSAVITYGAKEICGPGVTVFVQEWVSHPVEVGSCAPCSKHVAQEIVRFVQQKPALRVLEVGAGTGVFTRAIVAKLEKEARDHQTNNDYVFDVVEINEAFVDALKKEFAGNSNVKVHQADITQWKPTEKYDIIISALPFNIFDIKTVEAILKSYKEWVVPGGRISYIELAGIMNVGKLFMTKKAKTEFKKKYTLVKAFKDAHLQETKTVYLNVPPVHVHHLKF